jgi:hypothetical protein
VNSPTQITATTPSGAAGPVDVTVTIPVGGTSATGSSDDFTYYNAPTVTGISPTTGPTGGGTSVIVTGTNFSGASSVRFGANNATTFSVNSPTQITATSPAGAAGPVDITVTNPGGTSATSGVDRFTYVAPPTVTGISPTTGPTGGGTSVTVTGTNFSGASSVTFGSNPAANYTVNSPTQITAISPAGTAGPVDVTVTIPVGGTSATSGVDRFTYVAPPTVTGISPTTGPTGGGTSVIVTGTNFSGASSVTFGANPAASYTVNSPTQITATTPSGAAGPVDVTVTIPVGGTSATGVPDRFTYDAVPSAPASPILRASGNTLPLTWIVPATNGSPIISFVVTLYADGVAQAPITVAAGAPGSPADPTPGATDTYAFGGLSNGSSYTATVAAVNGVGTGPASPQSNSVTPAAGYWLVASDGGLFAFGSAQFFGSEGGQPLNEPIVGMASTSDGQGYWEVASDGGLFAFGDAGFYGSTGALTLNAPIVGMAPTPDGHGYWLVASDGGLFAFGDAGFFGSMGGMPLNKPIVGIAATPDGGGYWEVASDGGLFAFGDATFFGSEGGLPLNRPIVGIAATPDGAGYWEVATDGGLFAFGDATFFGSMGGKSLNEPIVGMTTTPDGGGYWEVATDGGLFAFGDATFFGSEGGQPLNEPIVGMTTPL